MARSTRLRRRRLDIDRLRGRRQRGQSIRGTGAARSQDRRRRLDAGERNRGDDIALVRREPDGSPDACFGVNGRVSFDAGGPASTGTASCGDGRQPGGGGVSTATATTISCSPRSRQRTTRHRVRHGRRDAGELRAGQRDQATALALQTDGGLVAMGMGPGSNSTDHGAGPRDPGGRAGPDLRFRRPGGRGLQPGVREARRRWQSNQTTGSSSPVTRTAPAGTCPRWPGWRQTALDTSFGGTGTVTHDLGPDWSTRRGGRDRADRRPDRHRRHFRSRTAIAPGICSSRDSSPTAPSTRRSATRAWRSRTSAADPGHVAPVTATALLRQSDGRLVAIGQDTSGDGP